MKLDDLNRSVTNAILRAEVLPAGSWEAESAFRDVADLEEEIAALVSAQTVEGELARIGAVTAALSASEPLRARQLAERYLGGALGDGTRTKLEELAQRADTEMQAAAANAPHVQPVRFKLRAASLAAGSESGVKAVKPSPGRSSASREPRRR
jgi:hypothetical protein